LGGKCCKASASQTELKKKDHKVVHPKKGGVWENRGVQGSFGDKKNGTAADRQV